MQGRFFQTDEVKRITDMFLKDTAKDWSPYINSLIGDGKTEILQYVCANMIRMRDQAYANVQTTADILFKVVQLNLIDEAHGENVEVGKDYKELCMKIARTIADYQEKSSLGDRVGGAQLKLEDTTFKFLVTGFDFNRSVIERTTQMINLLDTHLQVCDVEISVNPKTP
jgi:hypothetical protein